VIILHFAINIAPYVGRRPYIFVRRALSEAGIGLLSVGGEVCAPHLGF